MTVSNEEIRRVIAAKNLRKWEIALEAGISDTTLSKWFRRELTGERRERVLAAIDRLIAAKEREA